MRQFLAVLLAVLLAVGAAMGVRTVSTNFQGSNACKNLDPDDNWFLWWRYECDKPASGGGGSGAGME